MADISPPVEDAEHLYELDRKIGKMNWDLEEINMVSAQINLPLILENQCTSETEMHQLMMERVMQIRKIEETQEITMVTELRKAYLSRVETYCKKQYPLLLARKAFSEVAKMTFAAAKEYEAVLHSGEEMKKKYQQEAAKYAQISQNPSQSTQSSLKRTSSSSDLSIMEKYLEKKQKTHTEMQQTHFKGEIGKKFDDKYYSHRYFRDDNHNEMIKVYKKSEREFLRAPRRGV